MFSRSRSADRCWRARRTPSPGGIDTDMLDGVPAIKAHPDSVASSIVEAIMRGDTEVFPDRVSAMQGPALLGIDRNRDD